MILAPPCNGWKHTSPTIVGKCIDAGTAAPVYQRKSPLMMKRKSFIKYILTAAWFCFLFKFFCAIFKSHSVIFDSVKVSADTQLGCWYFWLNGLCFNSLSR